MEEKVGVAVVIGEVTDFVNDNEREGAVVPEPSVQTSGGFLGTKVDEQLGGSEEEDGVTGEDGLVSDVLRDHGLAQALRSDQDDVAAFFEEVQSEGGLDGLAVDLLGPGPVEVGHGLEATDPAAGQASFEAASGAVVPLGFDEVLE